MFQRILLLACVFVSSVSAAYAADVRVIATVREDAITSQDIEDRMKIALSASGLADTPDIRDKLRGQILQVLVDERLYLQEAARLGIKLSDADMTRAIAGVESHNNLRPGEFDAFVKSQGVSKEAVLGQIRAQLLWNKIIAQRVRPKVMVSAQELQEAIEKISNATGLTEIQIGEIALPVESAEEERTTQKRAENLVKQLREGGDFAAVARQFSRSPSASSGGMIGWVSPTQLGDNIADAIKRLARGGVSEPIRQNDGFYIYKLYDQRALIAVEKGDTEVAIRQLFVPIASPKKQEGVLETLNALRNEIHSCDDFTAVAERAHSTLSPQLMRVQLKTLHDDIAPVVEATPVGAVTPVIRSDAGAHLIVVCEKIDATPPLARKEQISERLTNEKISMQAKRYIRSLRREAFIDVKG